MSAPTTTEVKVIAGPPKVKKQRPARKQVKAGDVEKKEAPQTGKEYSALLNTALNWNASNSSPVRHLV